MKTYQQFVREKLKSYIAKYGKERAFKEIGNDWRLYKKSHGVSDNNQTKKSGWKFW